jgi:hypothetical protein
MDHHFVGSATRDSAPPATVDAVIQEIAKGRVFGLVCVRCGDEEEPVVALVTLRWEPPEHFSLCRLCYREFRSLALGEVT